MSEKKGILGGLFGGKKSGSGCCNMKIVEEPEGCSCCCDSPEDKTACCSGAGESSGKVTSIKILGPGCKNCHALLENTQAALKETGSTAEVEYVTDMATVAKYGIMSTPGLVINEKVVSMGKVMKPGEIAKLLQRPVQ